MPMMRDLGASPDTRSPNLHRRDFLKIEQPIPHASERMSRKFFGCTMMSLDLVEPKTSFSNENARTTSKPPAWCGRGSVWPVQGEDAKVKWLAERQMDDWTGSAVERRSWRRPARAQGSASRGRSAMCCGRATLSSRAGQGWSPWRQRPKEVLAPPVPIRWGAREGSRARPWEGRPDAGGRWMADLNLQPPAPSPASWVACKLSLPRRRTRHWPGAPP